MPLFPPAPARGAVPLLNSACPWASSAEDLAALWACPHTSAVTTRTCTLDGFADDASRHQVAFYGSGAESSANSFGYSPHPLASYLAWLRPLLAARPSPSKQVIFSIAGTLVETAEMLSTLQAFADEFPGLTIATELNASCPNIPGHPPPAYVERELHECVALLAAHASPTLKVGVKLPPYTYDEQFAAVVRALSAVGDAGAAEHPISFLTATNTLGQGLVFARQISDVPASCVAQTRAAKTASGAELALPGTGTGGLAGAAVHQLALGNIARLALLLRGTTPASPAPATVPAPADARLRGITLIGVGGAHDAAGVERFRRAGADAVACATALGREGLDVFERMRGNAQAKL
ncbi:hypothetical protein JCM3770_005481 [Rhodotorula araucariae]